MRGAAPSETGTGEVLVGASHGFDPFVELWMGTGERLVNGIAAAAVAKRRRNNDSGVKGVGVKAL